MLTATVNGIELGYDHDGQGTPVLLLSGLGGGPDQWAGLRPHIHEAGFSSVAIANRGILPSTVPAAPFSIADMARDTAGLIEHIDCGPCFVAGSSMGGFIAQQLALTRPDLVLGVVLAIGGGNMTRPGADSLAFTLECLRSGGDLARRAWRQNAIDSTVTPEHRMDEDEHERVIAEVDASALKIDDWTSRTLHADAVVRWAAMDHLQELEELSMPALVIGHQYDPAFSQRGREEAAEAIPSAELVLIPSEAHMARDPATYVTWAMSILGFLTKQRP